ncbi:HD domain-containing protein [Heyndrickxia sporothermodurans]|uniref:HD domain-containing protein n=1 Tax=Heyndrickxia sporothermodurans TaxID=46224 RepID=A0AB37HNX7_9BACI|nr:HD domain-containing phosphohydrolase [Heyndrickxia sporothermodurans]MBL5768770.1 HD domain-containing protein [Heyndrickxia sporothermodurans]MBL5772490.1 HD domain-containing protein [Heyndrickxia sporothermodurans]MBL5775965.1 HD domain-containing protein [Heyndrickxia sporothermodurans]MBL5779535.1 HD domain-containing protein [Heyndrickxia sporothermodurans]MBL5783102.1 HD domain-containing protein [Heyndrickxia sporothermodurans]
MKINIDGLRVGSILAEDVMGMTSSPIIPRGTVISLEHIDVLKAFFIREVEIESIPNGQKRQKGANKNHSEVNVTKAVQVKAHSIFPFLFSESVKKYKADFQKWQSGTIIDIANVRDYLYPLLEIAEEENIALNSLFVNNPEDYIYYHSISVGILSGLIAKRMGDNKGRYYQTALAGCLANAGMAKISPRIISKQTTLTDSEKAEIQEHPNYSLKMVQNSPLLKSETKLAIFQHHEKLDGSGYPMGVKGKQYYSMSRIITVADVFHALVSDRLYKKKIAPLKALEIMKIDEFGKFDLEVINTLLSMIANLSIGTKVKISNGSFGEVVFIKQTAPIRPLIRLNDGEIIDLEKERNLYIEEVY